MRNKLLVRGSVGAVALALAVTACGSSGAGSPGGGSSHSASPSAMHSMPASPAPGAVTNTAAAQLYAGLDQLLREHVDLTANVVQTAITKGPSSGATKQALAALDQNTQGLGAAIGSVYGSAAQAQFLKLWRAHIGYFVNYTLGVATHNKAKVATANKDLAGYTAQFSQFIAGATKLPAVRRRRRPEGPRHHAGDRDQRDRGQEPVGRPEDRDGSHAHGRHRAGPGQGHRLRQGHLRQRPGAGSSLRAALTGLLIQHVAATAFVVQTAVAHGGSLTTPEVKGAIGALTDNTNQLGAAIGSVYGPAAQAQFLKLWNAHIGYFVNYTLGVATHNKAKVTTANKDLAGYITQFSQFIAGATKLPAAAVAADLQGSRVHPGGRHQRHRRREVLGERAPC